MARKLRRALAWGSGLVAAGALASVLFFAPVYAAAVCPACYGFSKAAQGLWLEKGHALGAAARAEAMLGAAQARVAAFFPQRRANPTYFVCDSTACARRMGWKGAKAVTYGKSFVVVYPQGRDVTFLAHELTHAEFHARIGFWGMARGAIPAWFDEGLAVVVSRDARYLDMADGRADECRVAARGDLPVTAGDWRRAAGDAASTIYPAAACRVLGWLKRHGGAGGLRQLIADMHAGKPFNE